MCIYIYIYTYIYIYIYIYIHICAARPRASAARRRVIEMRELSMDRGCRSVDVEQTFRGMFQAHTYVYLCVCVYICI